MFLRLPARQAERLINDTPPRDTSSRKANHAEGGKRGSEADAAPAPATIPADVVPRMEAAWRNHQHIGLLLGNGLQQPIEVT